MKRALLLAAVALVVGGHAQPASAAPDRRPVQFLEGVVSALVANDYATAWLSLHPVHQKVAPEAEYVACEASSPVVGRLVSLVPVRTRRKSVAVAGVERPAKGVVVTFRLRLADPETGASVTFVLDTATVQVAHRWVWMLPRSRYERYQSDACGPL